MGYLFKCENCGVIEVYMRATEYKPLQECPNCGGKCERIFTPIRQVWHTDGSYKYSNNK